MPRRLTGECQKCGHTEEYVIEIRQRMKCSECGSRKVEVVWDEAGPGGAPGFRIKGMTKRF